jgi:hypothetical protein
MKRCPVLFPVLFLLLCSLPALARPNYTGYSGAPGRQTCAISCHGNSNGTATLTGFPLMYTPGETYALTLARTSGSSINNFNGSCRLGTGTSNAGTLGAGTGTSTYSTTGESNGIHLSSYNQNSATFNWTAPAAGAGTVRLYIAAYQGTNTNGQTTELTLIAEEAPSGTPELVIQETRVVADSDNDGIAEPGESVELLVNLGNIGDGPATGITGTLGGAPDWITIQGAASAWPDLPASGSADGTQAFLLQISPEAPALADLLLTLQVDTDQGPFSLEPALGVGTRVPYQSVDCEGDLSDWIQQAGEGWESVWHISSQDASSASHAWKFGDPGDGSYPAHGDGRLVGPAWTLPEGALLSFMHRIEGEISGTYPDSAYDGAVLELSTDEGQNWLPIMPLGGYNKHFRWLTGSGDPAGHPFPGGTPCYSGSLDWQEARFDLSPWAGQSVRIGWRFGSDDGTQLEGWFVDDIVLSGLEGEVVVDGTRALPAGFRLLGVYPNPFNPGTTIRFFQAHAGEVRIGIHDLRGNRVQAPLGAFLPAGESEMRLDAQGLPSGMYLLRVQSGSGSAVQKVLLLK